MITNISLHTVWVRDVDEARAFYVDILGFEPRTDVTMGDFRWCTISHPNQPELELNLMVPGPPLDDKDAEQMRRMLDKGSLNAGGLRVDDCRKTFEELSGRGVEFTQEPTDRPYGVEAVMRDNSGNWWVLVEPKEYSQADLEGQSF